jgi:hypothetical protein
MLRWLKFEILDIEAILEAISKKNAMQQQELLKAQRRDEEIKMLKDIKDGRDTLKTFFMSKKDKV